MKINGIKTELVRAGEKSIDQVLIESLPSHIDDGSVIAVSSKIIALCENRVVEKQGITKTDLIKKEADYYTPDGMNKYGFNFTILNNTFIPSAGIDESNSDGYFVLWPENPQQTANQIRAFLRGHYGLERLGIIITDSTCMPPMRSGTIGIMLAHSGFKAVRHWAGKEDLFGRKFEVARSSVGGGLAAAANVVMGEGDEQTPLAVISDVPFVEFTASDPTEQELEAVYISPEEDLYAPFILSVPWQKGRAEKDLKSNYQPGSE